MNKRIIKTLSLLIIFCMVVLSGCASDPVEPIKKECEHVYEWVWDEEAKCNKSNNMYYKCKECGNILETKEEFKDHEYVEERVEPTCTENGYVHTTCKNCKYIVNKILLATGHTYKYVVDKEATSTENGIRHIECETCHEKAESFEYANNGVSAHGQLSVKGTDLVDKDGNKMRLAGISTHGLQWCGQFVNYNTFAAFRDEFGINVMRLACYPDEGGYMTGSDEKQEEIYQLVAEGIRICTELDMYVIVDWHMLGNQYYTDGCALFFSRLCKEFKDYENIIYEIMNEPSREATWTDCVNHAKRVVPIIRTYQPKAVVLIGTPSFSADLVSPANKPLNYSNIMYTYHFYAGDNTFTNNIVQAERNGLPVFISEHGGMNADGDGPIATESLAKWYQTLDTYNLSFVAWNLSNTACSASMFKTTTTTLDDLSEEKMKEWGPIYRDRVRSVMGLSKWVEE